MSAPCAHCGVEMEPKEGQLILLSDELAFLYHPWCLDEAWKRIVTVRPLEGEMWSDVVDVSERDTSGAADSETTEGTTPST